MRPSGLGARGIGIAIGDRHLVWELSFEAAPGEFVAVLGRNGSGKTLTLHTLAGLRRPEAGSVFLDGDALATMRRRAVARRLGLLAQDLEDSFVTTAIEAVLIGRHPHLEIWQWESPDDERIAREALAAVELAALAERPTDTLSGGEMRRVAIAALLAQDPSIYLLDEPTNHLDPRHQRAILGLFRELTRAGRTVVATLHDPTIAARFADRALLLFGDGRWRAGPAHELLTASTLSELYEAPMLEIEKDGRRIFVSA